jgi:hypothetical protein
MPMKFSLHRFPGSVNVREGKLRRTYADEPPRSRALNLTHKIQKSNRKGEEGEKGMKYLGFSLFFSAA